LVLDVSAALHKAEASEMLLRLAAVAQRSLDELYLLHGPSPDLELDQAGLRDGAKITADYVNHNELGLAFEHLLHSKRPAVDAYAGTDLRFLLVEAGVDLMVFAIAMSAVVSAAAGWTLLGAAQGRRASQPLLWTLFTTVLLVFAAEAFWTRVLLILATT
jgi:hypothetical protein